MRTITLIFPFYNDWESLRLILRKIEKKIKKKEYRFQVLIINDNSTKKNKKKLNHNKLYKNIKSINLKLNLGSQKAIATGIKYISNNLQNFGDEFIIMDSDGEDDYSKISKILDLTRRDKEIDVITVNRSSRKESLLFRILYEVHLIITFFLTFKYIRYGNYSYLNSKALKFISKKKDLWLAYSASIEKNLQNKKNIIAARKKRFFGKSKMNYWQLFSHSIKIHLVFAERIIVNYFFYYYYFNLKFRYLASSRLCFYFFIYPFSILIIIKFSGSNIKFSECLKTLIIVLLSNF